MTPIDRSRKALEGVDVRRVLEQSDLPIEIATALADMVEGLLQPEAGATDATRWRKLLDCQRIRLLGYARGGPEGGEGPIRHIGFEFTTDSPPYCDLEIIEGRKTLTDFVDSMEAPRSPQGTIK